MFIGNSRGLGTLFTDITISLLCIQYTCHMKRSPPSSWSDRHHTHLTHIYSLCWRMTEANNCWHSSPIWTSNFSRTADHLMNPNLLIVSVAYFIETLCCLAFFTIFYKTWSFTHEGVESEFRSTEQSRKTVRSVERSPAPTNHIIID